MCGDVTGGGFFSLPHTCVAVEKYTWLEQMVEYFVSAHLSRRNHARHAGTMPVVSLTTPDEMCVFPSTPGDSKLPVPRTLRPHAERPHLPILQRRNVSGRPR